jgi:hypothetical protein
MKNTPPPGRRLVSDWLGMRVKTTAEMRNGMTVIPAGLNATVEGISGGLILRGDPCTCCGVQVLIRRVPSSDVAPA